MCHQHMNPEEACKVHQDIQAKYSLGVHWGTFMMSDEHYLDPPKDFEKAREDHGLEKGSCFTSHLGETIIIEQS
jgi:N-acyl-phosphatidylethanolamine-hydrolysing phospholipase D